MSNARLTAMKTVPTNFSSSISYLISSRKCCCYLSWSTSSISKLSLR